MSKVLYTDKFDQLMQYLIIALGFFMPLSVALGNILMVMIVALFVFSGGLSLNNFVKIRNNKIILVGLLFYLSHVIGMLWTENTEWGLVILKKMIDFLVFLPILWLVTKRENAIFYISAFLLAIFITANYSLFISLEILDPFNNGNVNDPTPFMSRISHGPFLAFAFYLQTKLLFDNDNKKIVNIFLIISLVITFYSIFASGGRMGYVAFFLAIFVIFFQKYKINLKTILIPLLINVALIYLLIIFSSVFANRIEEAKSNIQIFFADKNVSTSIGLRAAFIYHTSDLIFNNPFFGVGTGDFPDEYKKINEKSDYKTWNIQQPHNMHLLILAQNGLFGYTFFLLLFTTLIRQALKNQEKIFRDLGLFLPILFFTISFSDSYLLGHFTTFLFIYFSSFIYKFNFERK